MKKLKRKWFFLGLVLLNLWPSEVCAFDLMRPFLLFLTLKYTTKCLFDLLCFFTARNKKCGKLYVKSFRKKIIFKNNAVRVKRGLGLNSNLIDVHSPFLKPTFFKLSIIHKNAYRALWHVWPNAYSDNEDPKNSLPLVSELQLGLNDYIIGVEWEYVDLTFHYSTSLHIFL